MLYIPESSPQVNNLPGHSTCDKNANMLAKREDKTLVRCSLVGDCMVGKTTMILAFTDGSPMDYCPTIFENYAGSLDHEGEEYTISVFDLSGKHEHEDLRAFSYGDSQAFVIFYSTVDRSSFFSVREFWVPEIRKHTKKKKPLILVATQCEQRNSTSYDMDDPVTSEEGTQLAEEIEAKAYIECSTPTKESADEIFKRVVENLKIKKRKSSTSKFFHKIMGR